MGCRSSEPGNILWEIRPRCASGRRGRVSKLEYWAGMSVTNVAKDASMAKSRRRWRLVLAFLCGAGLVWGGWAWWTDRRYKSAMEEIESEIVAGRYAIACRNLDKLLSWKADPNGGIAYLLGSCELARGRNQAAGEAWARVVPVPRSRSERFGAHASLPRIRATRRRRAAHQRRRPGSPQ